MMLSSLALLALPGERSLLTFLLLNLLISRLQLTFCVFFFFCQRQTNERVVLLLQDEEQELRGSFSGAVTLI